MTPRSSIAPVLTVLFALGCGSESAQHAQGGSGGGATSSTSTSSAGGSGSGGASAYEQAVAAATWTILPKGPTVGGGAKQDDIFFVSPTVGFAASGPKFSILKTDDGGATWTTSWNHPGTYFRALLFTDPQHGFAGNLGAGLSPSISDANVLYETKDGGGTWNPVTNITGPAPQGICNLAAADANNLFGVGRANGPAHLVQSTDGGATWTSKDLAQWFTMLIDVRFTSATEGIVAGMDKSSHCAVMRTTDGGATFSPAFTSATNNSLCWKLNFPSAQVGFVAVQDAAGGPGTFGKTTDGGKTWQELPLPQSGAPKAGYPAIGVGFITENVGWMSAEDPSLPSYRTLDGGTTWEVDAALKSPINRFRFVDKNTAYAIGGSVWKLDIAYTGP